MLTRAKFTTTNFPMIQKATEGTGIFPQTLLAIAIVESQGKVGNTYYPGQSPLARLANNYFGIKRGTGWTGETIRMATPNDAEKISVFRKYPSFEASVKDFIRFLQVNPRYEKAGVFDAPNYQEQILAIARAGYAESTNYAEIITKVADGINRTLKNFTQFMKETNKMVLPLIALGSLFFLYLKSQQSHD